tara:strand:- start:2620 stop:3399 length:780 start_codon:yes stop_codon:yes gene_type:complete
MKFGIMQGRLSEPVDYHYQEFPIHCWEREFERAKELSFCGLEWLITKNYYKNNPLFADLSILHNYPITSICMDNLVDHNICDEKFLNEKLVEFCEMIKEQRDVTLTIPILDDSDLNDDQKREIFCKLIKPIGEKYSNINFSFEAELTKEKLNEIVSLCENFYVTYDTGNITSCGENHAEYIRFFSNKILNVHIKDRTYFGKTVEPLNGDTDFDLIFENLQKINYNGAFILQTARGKDGMEIETVSRHKKIFEELHERYF